MDIYLLDAGGLFYIGILVGILFLVFAVLVEALVMKLMKYQVFGKAFVQSLIVNLLSALAGYLLMENAIDIFHMDNLEGIGALFVVTLIIEGIALYFLNKNHKTGKTISTTLLMNLASYSVLLIFHFMGSV